MKISGLTLPAALLLMIAPSGLADPISTLYLSYSSACTPIYNCISVLQGGSVTSIPFAYGIETAIAVSGDIRTIGITPGAKGGQYTLAGTPTGTSYSNPGLVVFDSTTDGTSNYLVDINGAGVYRTDRDFQNPSLLFPLLGYHIGITYDRSNNSLWIAGWVGTEVTNYSMSGVVLSSFDTGRRNIAALALDPADQTLWLMDGDTGRLEQYSKTGKHLSTGSFVSYALGGEFDLGSAVPEPSTLLLSGAATLGMALRLRRRS